jgi:hypothetical protein
MVHARRARICVGPLPVCSVEEIYSCACDYRTCRSGAEEVRRVARGGAGLRRLIDEKSVLVTGALAAIERETDDGHSDCHQSQHHRLGNRRAATTTTRVLAAPPRPPRAAGGVRLGRAQHHQSRNRSCKRDQFLHESLRVSEGQESCFATCNSRAKFSNSLILLSKRNNWVLSLSADCKENRRNRYKQADKFLELRHSFLGVGCASSMSFAPNSLQNAVSVSRSVVHR